MNDMSLRTKLNTGFGAILAILAILGITSFHTVQEMSDMVHNAIERSTTVERSTRLDAAIEKQAAGVRGFLLAGRDNLLDHDEEGKKEYRAVVEELGKTARSDDDKHFFAEIESKYSAYRNVLDREIQLRRAGRTKEAAEMAFSPGTSEVRNALGRTVRDFIAFQEKEKGGVIHRKDILEDNARMVIASRSVVGLGLGIALSALLSRSLVRRISGMLNMIQEIAANNLGAADLDVTSGDEVGRASLALNDMKNKLRSMIKSIAQTADQVASASEEMSSSASQQAFGTEAEKDQAQQVAVAMQEMSANVT